MGTSERSGVPFSVEKRKEGTYMRRGINPLAVVVMILIAAAAIVVAVLVRNALPPEAENFKGIVFWGIIIGIGGGGALFAGRKFNRRR